MLLNKPLVINLFGGACCGKSTGRADIFRQLKTKGINCEEAAEWIKLKVYEGNPYIPKDQVYIFAKQRKILKEIGDSVDVIISDSPLLLSIVYDPEEDPFLKQLVVSEFNKFNNVNYLLNRVKPYNPIGRYQTEEEAKEFDRKTKAVLDELQIPYTIVDGNDEGDDKIVKDILWMLGVNYYDIM